jgi:hypothetical protein
VVTDAQWDQFWREGYLPLGRVAADDELELLRRRVDDLALGRLVNPAVQFQLDTGGAYEELPGAVERLDRATLCYRKVQGLEADDRFAGLIRHPTFVQVCARVYGPHVPISLFRAMVMNKPAGLGTELPWHQDGGAVWELDRDPLVTIWVALDAATPDNGCMEIVPGSHRLGLLSWFGSTVGDEAAERHCRPEAVEALPVDAGHAVLMHNWLLHRSGANPSRLRRRAFTCCFLDGRTRNNLTGDLFPLLWGDLPGEPPRYLEQLRGDDAILRASIAEATRYAHSLEAELDRLRPT